MISVLTTLMPVLLIVLFGMLLRRRKVLSERTVSELKNLLTNNILPVVIFNALATAQLNDRSWIQIGFMMAILFAAFGLGFLVRRLVREPYRKYVPFMVTLYEGGMIAYPLYSQLCGSENLYRIAILDIAGILFCFGFYMNVLASVESGEKGTFKEGIVKALKTPAFVAALLGVIMDCTGLVDPFVASKVGGIYTAIVRTISAPLTPMILLVVGYSIEADREMIVPCLQTIGLRILIQAVMMAIALFAMRRMMGADPVRDKAILIFMSVPTTYSLQSFIKDRQGANFASTVNALYIFVTIAVFAAATQLN
jgi:predicted permease